MGKFKSIGDGLLNDISKTMEDINKEKEMNIVYLPLDAIQPNPKNKQSITDIEELAESIRNSTLHQPIEVVKNISGPTPYLLVGGERRYSAYRLLQKEDVKYNTIPSIIKSLDAVQLPISDDLKEQYLIAVTNKERRVETDADKYELYQIYKRVFTEARKNGYEVKGKTRNLIADAMKISPAQVGKMEYIEKHSSDETISEFLSGKISLNETEEVVKAAISQEKPKNTPKKKRISESLTEASYQVTPQIFEGKIPDTNNLFNESATIELTRKKYAALLSSIEKIEKEKQKIEKLLATTT